MFKKLMGVAALASIATAPSVAQASSFAPVAAAAAVQDAGDSHGGTSTVGYVALASIVVILVFVAIGVAKNEDHSTSP